MTPHVNPHTTRSPRYPVCRLCAQASEAAPSAIRVLTGLRGVHGKLRFALRSRNGGCALFFVLLKRYADYFHLSIMVKYGNLCAIGSVARPPCAAHWHVDRGDRISGRRCGFDQSGVRTKVTVIGEAARCLGCPAKWVSTSDPRRLCAAQRVSGGPERLRAKSELICGMRKWCNVSLS
jgi:hypothetical protein